MSLQDEVKELQRQVTDLTRRLQQKETLLAHVKNPPVIVAYPGKRLILNHELDAQYVIKTLQSYGTRITDNETNIASNDDDIADHETRITALEP